MKTYTVYLVALTVYVAALSALVAYLAYDQLRSSDTAEKQTAQFQTIASTLSVVQNTVNQTLQGTTVTYDGDDLNTYLESSGTITMTGRLYINDTASVNVSNIFSAQTIQACSGCNAVLFHSFSVTNLNSDTSVYIDDAFSTYCQITYSPTETLEACVNVLNSCRQLLVLEIPYTFTTGTKQTVKSVVKITRSYGSVCL